MLRKLPHSVMASHYSPALFWSIVTGMALTGVVVAVPLSMLSVPSADLLAVAQRRSCVCEAGQRADNLRGRGVTSCVELRKNDMDLCDDAGIEPVCGCDGETYDNACTAALMGVKLVSRGACPSDEDDPKECGPQKPNCVDPFCYEGQWHCSRRRGADTLGTEENVRHQASPNKRSLRDRD